jgi:hypothetical protein
VAPGASNVAGPFAVRLLRHCSHKRGTGQGKVGEPHFGGYCSPEMPRKKTKATPNVPKGAEIKIRLAPEDKALFEEAARRRGLSMSAWMRMVALDAARPASAQR